MEMDTYMYWILAWFFTSFPVMGKDLSDSVKVNRLYIETEKRVKTNREYYLKDETAAKYDLNLGLDLELPATFYYNNKVLSTTDSNQFRFIGYEFEVGARPFDGIDVYFGHFSGHALDQQYDRDFPQRNMIGIRWNIIGGK